MSREKFEEWYAPNNALTESDRAGAHYQMMLNAWLAGRESMRDEAAAVCREMWPTGGRAWDERQSACFEALSDCWDAIKRIEP